jgi:hypothetical protein
MSFSRRVPDSRDMSTRAYILAAVLLALSVAVLSACGNSGPTATPINPGTGTVSGTISVGPLCPVEPCTNPSNPFVGLKLVISDAGAVIRAVDVGSDGTYSATVPVGQYYVNLEPCEWLGCRSSMPRSIAIEADKTLTLDIDVDTGIR